MGRLKLPIACFGEYIKHFNTDNTVHRMRRIFWPKPITNIIEVWRSNNLVVLEPLIVFDIYFCLTPGCSYWASPNVPIEFENKINDVAKDAATIKRPIPNDL